MPKKSTVFAWDLGKASLGEAVRQGDHIVAVESFKIPEDHASLADERTRRRAYRTRKAHKAREDYLQQVFQEAGLETLTGRRGKELGDPRLEREFPAQGEDTCYTSSLLRIKLIEGEALAQWQVYKALHSAIQRRGYDSDVPWATNADRDPDKTGDDKDEAENAANAARFRASCLEMSDDADYHLPCFVDAWHMGLWTEQDGITSLRIDHHAQRARGYVATREAVETEVRLLFTAAQTQYPELGISVDAFLYGPTELAYASMNPDLCKKHGIREGAATDWRGVLSQKVPRFDNRMPNRCCCIPRYHVCRATDILHAQVHFLLGLINLRYMGGNETFSLTPAEVNECFQTARKNASKKDKDKKADQYKITKTAWNKWLAKNDRVAVVNNNEIPKPKTGGRSRYSRPALRIMRDLILSGDSPHAFRSALLAETDNQDPLKGLVPSDLDFLAKMPDDWERIHIPSATLPKSNEEQEAAIAKLIGSQGDPIVCHRLGVLHQRLKKLTATYGEPDLVALEFVREDFMGEKAKKRLMDFQKKRTKARIAAREEAKTISDRGSAPLKLQLLKEQGGRCIYTGDHLCLEQIDAYEIEHIVPRGSKYNGSDAMYNKVLTTHEANQAKAQQTPFEWLAGTPEWSAYLGRVDSMRARSSKKKINLLVSEDAPDMDRRYTGLAETAWIAKLSQQLVSLFYGWPTGEKGSERRVAIVSGGLVGKVRRQHGINKILYPEIEDLEKLDKKNREDDRHHGLDAMVISYIPTWARDPKKERYFSFPDGIDAPYFKAKIDTCIPTNLVYSKIGLEETVYAKRLLPAGESAVLRRDLATMGGDVKTWTVKKAKKTAATVVEPMIREAILTFLETSPSQAEWVAFASELRSNSHDHNGPLIKKVATRTGTLSEYADLSKDETGQYRRTDKNTGVVFYKDKEEEFQRHQILGHESLFEAQAEVALISSEIIGFFEAACLVELGSDISRKGSEDISAGRYRWKSYKHNRSVILERPGEKEISVSWKSVCEAGIKRLDA